jgi:hypothetical protein
LSVPRAPTPRDAPATHATKTTAARVLFRRRIAEDDG